MFDLSRGFDKVRSSDASDLFGGLSQLEKAEEKRFAGAALTNLARLEMAKKGVYAAPQQQQSSSRPSFGDRLLGLAGDVLPGLVGAGVSSLFNKSYADTSKPILSDQFTSPSTWNQNSQAVQGVYDSGFNWQSDPWGGNAPNINMGSWN